MKRTITHFFIFLFTAGTVSASHAQADSTGQQQTPAAVRHNTDSTQNRKELEESLSRAAAAAEKAAGSIKTIVENKADKLAKTSQPYIESLAASTASMIEKLAQELEKAVGEKPVKKTK